MEEMNIGSSQEEKVKGMFGWMMATSFVRCLEKYGKFHCTPAPIKQITTFVSFRLGN